MTEQYGSWREKKRAKLLMQKFIDVRGGHTLKRREDQIVEEESGRQIMLQLMNKPIQWKVRYHGVALPEELSLSSIRLSELQHSTKNCVNEKYINFLLFEDTHSVDWYILSPFDSY